MDIGDIETIYGAARTTSFTTSITLAVIPSTVPLLWPSPQVANSVEYTTISSPTNSLSRWFSSPLPVLVLTEINAIAFNTYGHAISTTTMLQAIPSHILIIASTVPAAKTCELNRWACWSAGKRVGIIIGLLVGVFVLFLIPLCCCCRALVRKGRRALDEEHGYEESKNPHRRRWEDRRGNGQGRRMHRKDSRPNYGLVNTLPPRRTFPRKVRLPAGAYTANRRQFQLEENFPQFSPVRHMPYSKNRQCNPRVVNVEHIQGSQSTTSLSDVQLFRRQGSRNYSRPVVHRTVDIVRLSGGGRRIIDGHRPQRDSNLGRRVTDDFQIRKDLSRDKRCVDGIEIRRYLNRRRQQPKDQRREKPQDPRSWGQAPSPAPQQEISMPVPLTCGRPSFAYDLPTQLSHRRSLSADLLNKEGRVTRTRR